jgi:hypothetical protein
MRKMLMIWMSLRTNRRMIKQTRTAEMISGTRTRFSEYKSITHEATESTLANTRHDNETHCVLFLVVMILM